MRSGALNARQVNLLLAFATSGAVLTGLASWTVGTGWGRWWTALHAMCGFAILVLAPAKMRGSVRVGMRRRRPTRWLSATFGVLVLATVGLGLAHSTGAWTGVGPWTSLWTHVLLAFSSIPLLVWHLFSRPIRARAIDVDRRLLIGGGATVVAAGAAVVAVETANRLAGWSGADRRFTGSHEVGSFDPDAMPTVSWIDDTAPSSTSAEAWELRVGDAAIPVAVLASRSAPMVASLDCTGGWWSDQRWDVVPVASVLDPSARSFEVTSATGYSRIFPMRDADSVYLAVGYDGRPLRRGHGAPVRIVAPGRRGPWWVKWVVSVRPTDRPAWMQLPFPPT